MIEMNKQFDSSKHPRMLYIVKKYVYLQADLGVVVGFGCLSSTNDSDEALGWDMT